LGYEALFFFDFGLWGEGAVFWVGGDFVDLFWGVFVLIALLFGQV
jgi:hypothetical protein